jgi:branched-subunit amino acid transport protein
LLFVGAEPTVSLSNPKLLSGAAAVAIFAASRSMIATISGGMAVFWLARAFFGA